MVGFVGLADFVCLMIMVYFMGLCLLGFALRGVGVFVFFGVCDGFHIGDAFGWVRAGGFC